MSDFQRDAKHTTDGNEPTQLTGGAPQPIDPQTGQHKAYWVLSEEERAGGFIRPLRFKYIHVGLRPKYPVRQLTAEETERWKEAGYTLFETYPEDSPEGKDGKVGRFWTPELLSSGCMTETTMSRTIAETYAKDPNFYGGTFCCKCKTHLPVEQFEWEDGSKVGS